MFPNPQQLKKVFLLSSFTAIAIFFASLSNPASAETAYDGFYIGGLGGLAVTPNITGEDIGGTRLSGTITYERPFSGGFYPFTAGLDVGYKYGPFRYELEGVYMFTGYKSFLPNNSNDIVRNDFSGSTKTYAGLANVYYNFDTSGNSGYFYLGLGGGYGNVKNKLSTRRDFVESSSSGFAMQGTVGYAYNMSSSASIGLDYRYFILISQDTFSEHRYQNHLFNIGINYYFG